MKRRSLALACSAVFLACAGRSSEVSVKGGGGPAIRRIEGAPADAPGVDRIPITVSGNADALSVLGGMVAVGTDTGLLAGSRTQPNSLSAVPVLATGSDPTSTGAISLLSRRAGGGLLAYAQNGLFHDSNGSLLLSPFSQTVAGMSITSLDSFGTGDAEELWLVGDGSAAHAGRGQLAMLHITGTRDSPQAVAAVDAGRAIIAVEGTAYLVDLATLEASVIADSLGRVNGFDRAEDGTVYLATESGLLARARSGEVSLRTFSPAGSSAQNVLSVSAVYGSLLAATSQSVLQVQASSSSKVSSAAGPARGRALSVDTNGDSWVADQGKLYRLLTGKPVSFAADVRPFFDQHCMVCHRTGAQGAPVHDFDDFETAKSFSSLIARRLQALGVPPMPPPSAETLTAADYAVVIRWVGGGLQP